MGKQVQIHSKVTQKLDVAAVMTPAQSRVCYSKNLVYIQVFFLVGWAPSCTLQNVWSRECEGHCRQRWESIHSSSLTHKPILRGWLKGQIMGGARTQDKQTLHMWHVGGPGGLGSLFCRLWGVQGLLTMGGYHNKFIMTWISLWRDLGES